MQCPALPAEMVILHLFTFKVFFFLVPISTHCLLCLRRFLFWLKLRSVMKTLRYVMIYESCGPVYIPPA